MGGGDGMNLFTSLFRLIRRARRKAEAGPDRIHTGGTVPQSSTLRRVLDNLQDCADVVHRHYPSAQVDIVYFDHLVSPDTLYREVVRPLMHMTADDEVRRLLAQSQYEAAEDPKDIIVGILAGRVAIFYGEAACLVDAYDPKSRSITQSETETIMTGPHDAFNENVNDNLSLIRRRLRSSHLKAIKLAVGEVARNDVYILYMDGIANMDNVRQMIDRIQAIEVDAVQDTHMLVQLIDDNAWSVFPQFITTERPDSIAAKLASGRVVLMLDGSPVACSAPASLFEFFSSPDDYYQRWLLGTATRILRFIAFVVTISFTAIYVAVSTHHYEMIPENLLRTFVDSRSRVPFPPVYEALLMETMIELLREAGARLPTKIGQTIGIVGGIVIGQAAVQAGFASNILVIAVASSAIASFVIPSYIMSAAIRLIRFGLIVLAAVWGNFGLAVGLSIVVIHLSGLTSLGVSYLSPVAPFLPADWNDTFIRSPFRWLGQRPLLTRTRNKQKQKVKK